MIYEILSDLKDGVDSASNEKLFFQIGMVAAKFYSQVAFADDPDLTELIVNIYAGGFKARELAEKLYQKWSTEYEVGNKTGEGDLP